ncbi:MAG: PQQ-dependent sugar dehydrogenase [Acidobacteriia bacterium]|nr:PQQ-dependent sugar dehydrogenase [Terriglobia bacterium]
MSKVTHCGKGFTMRYAFALALAAKLATAQQPEIRLTEIAAGLRNVTDIQHAADGSGRSFFVQQNGIIRVFQNSQLLAAPLLDIQTKTRSSGECGLLGLAFPPGFTSKRYFYVNYTSPNCGATIVARYHLSAGAGVADPLSEQIILTQAQPFSNHNGGQLRFAPDGFLWIGFGDGGSGGDPQNNAQNNRSWLGKMLRIDVESGQAPYRVPPDNPFAADPRYLPEIWATGLRNPWRFSFDRATGDLWIGDVGQNRAEEINYTPAGSRGGENYGWRLMEGLLCFLSGCSTAGLVLPVLEYDTRNRGDVSVTGGYVYRGRQYPSLTGTYIYGDYNSGRIWGLRNEAGQFRNRLLLESGLGLSTFGEDEAGELYLTDYRGGRVYRMEATQAPAERPAATAAANAASFESGAVAGSAVTVFATGITAGAGITSAASIPLPRSLAGLVVSVNGRDAPLYAVANANGTEQVNIQIPWETTGERASIILTRESLSSVPLDVSLLAAQPGVFTTDGSAAIVVRNRDHTLVTSQRPLEPGEFVYFYVAGLGAVTHAPASGSAGPSGPLANALTTPTVTIDGVSCPVQFAGLAPGFVGLYQVNISIPAGISSGERELLVHAGKASSKAVRVDIK